MTQARVEMDQLDDVAAKAFPGYLVRKDLVRRYARQYPVPTYVVEFLLGRYCASTDEKGQICEAPVNSSVIEGKGIG